MTDPLAELSNNGVSIWLDDLSRQRLTTGSLARLVAHDHVVGVTTNPTIFAKAITGSDVYAGQLQDLSARGAIVREALRGMTAFDVRWACDVLRPAYDATGGVDGRVSIEVDPRLAYDTEATIAEARFLWWLVDRPNLFIKIPAARQGLPAIAACLAEGISINVTLIFSLVRYGEVMDAFLAGLERARQAGRDLSCIASVASFFVSRVDTEVDARLDKIGTPAVAALRGRAAIADAVIIGVILAASAGLGFANEYRAERAAQALHDSVRHTVIALRDGKPGSIPVTGLVPGDVVRLRLGTVAPADMRLLTATALEADESVLTGESLPAVKTTAAVPPGAALGDLASMALMGTVVRAGEGTAVVVATGSRAEFGRIAAGLGARQPETDFQAGLRRFSVLLLRVALVLSVFIVIIGLLLRRPLIESLLFALAIAVGITPQLLPAVVSTSLATGSRRLARRKVLVKRLVAIEDLGDMDILVTDKTGTLTEGRVTFTASVNPAGGDDGTVRDLGLLAVDPGQADEGGNTLDSALWQAAGGWPAGSTRLASLPFDHERRLASTLVSGPDGRRLLVTKGAPEAVLAASSHVPAAAQATLDKLFAGGSRVIAVASRDASGLSAITPADESGLTLAGFLIFLDPPKPCFHPAQPGFISPAPRRSQAPCRFVSSPGNARTGARATRTHIGRSSTSGGHSGVKDAVALGHSGDPSRRTSGAYW